MKREYATTSAWYDRSSMRVPDPDPPEGEGWRLVCMAAVSETGHSNGVTLFWSWEREQEESLSAERRCP